MNKWLQIILELYPNQQQKNSSANLCIFYKILASLLHENSTKIESLQSSILSLCIHDDLDTESLIASMLCCTNLCLKTSSKYPLLLSNVYQFLFRILNQSHSDLRVKTRALKSIQLVLNESKSIASKPHEFEMLLRMCLRLLYLSDECNSSNRSRRDSTSSTNSFNWRNPFPLLRTDSKFLGGNLEESRMELLFKQQSASLSCLVYLAKGFPKLMFPFWNLFMPLSNDKESLILMQKCHLKPEIRLSSGELLYSLLDGSKQYLSISDDVSKRSSSFCSLSQKTADIVYYLQASLLEMIVSEENGAVLAQDIHCMTALVNNTLYDKLSKDHRKQVFDGLESKLSHPSNFFIFKFDLN